MALSATNPAIVDVMEDLDLYRAILESLDEQRPDAVEQRQETLEVIKGLETKLAELRGNDTSASSSRSSPSRPSTSNLLLPEAQLDGLSFSRATTPSSPPRFGCPAFSYLHPQHQSSRPDRSSEMPSARKRPRKRPNAGDDEEDEDEDDYVALPSSKRAAISRTVPAFSQSASSDHSSPTTRSNSNEMDDLLQMFGLDGEDTLRALQEEQKRAEEWLEARKEQERRDAEFARSLMESYEAPRPSSSAQGSSSTIHPGPIIPERTLPPPTPNRHPQPSQMNPLFADTRPTALGSGSDPGIIFQRPQFNSARFGSDSDDSDIAEITPGDFHSHSGLSPTFPGRTRHLPQYQNFHGDAGSGPIDLNRPVLHPGHSRGVMPGQSSIGPSEHMYQNAMATLAGGDYLKRARGLVSPNSLNPLSAGSYLKQAINGLMDYEFGRPLSHRDIEDFYEYGPDSKQLNEEIKQLLETIRPDTDISEDDWEGTPEALKYTLMKHQKLGLAWMKSKEESDQKGGILADDMGLGKTIQAISLMVSRPSIDPERKTTLIIAPVALMQQWKREIERMLRPGRHQLLVYVLHGEKRATSFRDLKKYDVVLTTFGTLSSELKRVEKYDELLKSGAEEPTLTRQYLNSLPCLGPTSKWYRVIIDEAQCIKNRNTKAAIACCRLNSIYRWCMSGTPMMNNVEELHSLLKFLRNRPYGNLDPFSKDFTRPLKSGNQRLQEKAMTQLRVLLKAVLLRRTKESKIDGEPILKLRPRVSEKVHTAFSDDELELYKSLENQTRLQFSKYLQDGTVGRNYSNILVLLLRLRQACCHPHLIRDFSVKLNETTDGVDFVANAKAFSDEVIIRLRDNDDLECPICMDAVDNPVIFFPCGHSTCAECFSRISDPSLSLQQGVDGAVQVKCPNCRGIVDPKKITDHASFRKVHFSESSDDSQELGGSGTATDEDEDEDDDDDDSDDDSLADFLASDSDDAERLSNPKKSKGKGKAKLVTRPKKTLAELRKEASKNLASKRKYLRRMEKTWITSAKIEKTMEIIRGIQHGDESEKTIIFSQFTSLLDLLEVPIAREGHRYRRYDGSMKPQDRNSAVLEFTDDPDCKIMLVSLKAGNSGLNLVAASQVIIFDPFWNPYIEEQAIDRAHRIGQMREVHVHRILVPETVEDRIVELQDKKRELIDGALDEKASKHIARLSTRELAYLFGIQN